MQKLVRAQNSKSVSRKSPVLKTMRKSYRKATRLSTRGTWNTGGTKAGQGGTWAGRGRDMAGQGRDMAGQGRDMAFLLCNEAVVSDAVVGLLYR